MDEPAPDRIDRAVQDLSYPAMRTDAAIALEDISVETGDGETSLGVIVSEADTDCFDSADALYEAIRQRLPERVDVPDGTDGSDS